MISETSKIFQENNLPASSSVEIDICSNLTFYVCLPFLQVSFAKSQPVVTVNIDSLKWGLSVRYLLVQKDYSVTINQRTKIT